MYIHHTQTISHDILIPLQGIPASDVPSSNKHFRNLSFYSQAHPESLCNTAYVTFEYIGDARLCAQAILGS